MTENTDRRGRRRKQLLHELEETRGDLNLNEETLDRTVWRTHFGRGYGPVGMMNMSDGLNWSS